MSITPAITMVALNPRSHSFAEDDLRVLFGSRVVPRAAVAERALAARASQPVDGPSVFMGLLGKLLCCRSFSTGYSPNTYFSRLLLTPLQL